MKLLVLGMGNDIISDDAAGLEAARRLRPRIGDIADVAETSVSGVALLELFVGYERAIVIDAIKTGKDEPGTIKEWFPENLDAVQAPSPHYFGMPELLALAKQLELEFPSEIKIFSIEAEDPHTIKEGLTPAVEAALPGLVRLVEAQAKAWAKELCRV